MSIFDLIFALLLGWAIFIGVQKGFIIQVATLLALVLGVYLAFKFSFLMAKWITGLGVGAKVVSIISFSLTFIVVVMLTYLLGQLLHRFVHLALLGWVNRILGAIFAVLKTALILSVVLYVVNIIDGDLHFMPRKQVEKSKLYKPLSSIVPSLMPYLDFDKVKQSVKDVDKKLGKKVEEFK